MPASTWWWPSKSSNTWTNWREFLLEVRRVLAPDGPVHRVDAQQAVLHGIARLDKAPIPSTCTNSNSTNSARELKPCFPHVSLYLENHVEGVTFQPHEPGNTAEVRVDAASRAPDESHFFVAVCADRPLTGNPTFVYVPRAANVLREREQHIVLLESEIAQKNEWLADAQRRHEELLARFGEQKESLERSNRWAESLNRELEERAARIAELQEEMAREQEAARQMAEGYAAKVAELEADIRAKTQWAIDTETRLTAEVRHQTGELGKAVEACTTPRRNWKSAPSGRCSLQEEAARLAAALAVGARLAMGQAGTQGGIRPGAAGQLTWLS